jgi:uncharacterized membrane protein YgdD (TMEM256/DUF423 family)
MARWWFILGSINAGLSVAAGAFGAHGLKRRLSAEMLAVFETGARYHMYHALALLAVAFVSMHGAGRPANGAGWCFVVGIVLFSGSLYTLALTGVTRLGMITPFGGTLFIIGWALLVWAGYRLRSGG